jgi:hypothetical protein
MKLFYATLFLIISSICFSQNVTILPGSITPGLSGTYPRITYDAILALPSPVKGDIAYDTTFECLRVYNGIEWVCTHQNPDEASVNASPIATASGASNNGNEVAVDNAGNVYVIGGFSGTITFTSTTLSSSGNTDIFIAKYSSSGTLIWVKKAGGASFDYGYGIKVDNAGNLFITGYYGGTATFGAFSKTSAGFADIFLAKLDNSGNFLWVQSAGGSGSDGGKALKLDAAGDPYFTGYFSGTANFAASASITAGGSLDVFIAKYSSAGALLSLNRAGGSNDDNPEGIDIDANGKVYITGNFLGTTAFGTLPVVTSTGSYDIFLAKYDPITASWSWLQTAGGTGYDNVKGIVIDASGGINITGFFSGTATFSGISLISNGSDDIFLSLYDLNGFIFLAKNAGGAGSVSSNSITTDGLGNIYITGSFSGNADFGGINKIPYGSSDFYIAKLSNNYKFEWVRSYGSKNAASFASRIAVSTTNNIYTTGYFYGTVKFGAISKTAAPASSYNMFLLRQEQGQ